MDNGFQNFLLNTLNEDFSINELAKESGFLDNLYPQLQFDNEFLEPLETTEQQKKKEKKRKKEEEKK